MAHGSSHFWGRWISTALLGVYSVWHLLAGGGRRPFLRYCSTFGRQYRISVCRLFGGLLPLASSMGCWTAVLPLSLASSRAPHWLRAVWPDFSYGIVVWLALGLISYSMRGVNPLTRSKRFSCRPKNCSAWAFSLFSRFSIVIGPSMPQVCLGSWRPVCTT